MTTDKGNLCDRLQEGILFVAEALGRQVPASKYSPDINLHPIFGDEKSQKKHYRECFYGPMSDT